MTDYVRAFEEIIRAIKETLKSLHIEFFRTLPSLGKGIIYSFNKPNIWGLCAARAEKHGYVRRY
jgi:hypothetical protein